jgi:hypothetical protein
MNRLGDRFDAWFNSLPSEAQALVILAAGFVITIVAISAGKG